MKAIKQHHTRLRPNWLGNYVLILLLGVGTILLVSNDSVWTTVKEKLGQSPMPARECVIEAQRNIAALEILESAPSTNANIEVRNCSELPSNRLLLNPVDQGAAIDMVSNTIDVTSLEAHRIVSLTTEDPGKLASVGSKVTLVFVESRDTRTLSANAISSRIEDVLVLRVVVTDGKVTALVVAIRDADQVALDTLARFANEVPAQVVRTP